MLADCPTAAVSPDESLPGDRWSWRYIGDDHWFAGRLLALDVDSGRAVVALTTGSICSLDYHEPAELDCWRLVSPRRRG